MDRVLIIVPAYNEQDVIESTVSKLVEYTNKQIDINYIVIDDGSTDDTVKILKRIKANYISHPLNLGIGEPFKTGIKYGLNYGFSKFINFDADGQHRLDQVERLLKCEEGEYVVGSRFLNEAKPRTFRMLGSRMLTSAIRLKTGKLITDPTSGLLLINNISLAEFYISQPSNKPEPSLYPKILKNFKVIEVQVEMDDRLLGTSYFNPYSSVHFMLEQIFMIILKG